MQPLYLMTNNNTLAYEDGGGGGSAIGAGALRYRDGKFAGTQAALIEEGTTNYVRNPNGAVNTSGWLGSSLTRVVDGDGLTWLRVEGDGSNWLQINFTNAVSVQEDDPFTFSAHAKMNYTAASQDLFRVYNSGGVYVPMPYLSGEFDFSVSYVIPAELTSTIIAIQDRNVPPAGSTIQLRRVMAELKDHPTTPCPEYDGEGSLLPGYSWTGTANDSASTRDAASITIPVDYDDVGSWACWYSEDMGQTWQFHYAELFGPIGDYGAILPVPDTTTSVVDSARALLLGPLAIWADTLTEDEQAALENHGAMWTWDIASGNFPSGSRGPIHVIPAIPVIPATDVLPAIEVVAVAT